MHTETNKNKNKDKHGVPPTKRFSLLGSLVARLEALASLRDPIVKQDGKPLFDVIVVAGLILP